MNPFKYGAIVSGADFCGREKLLERLLGHIDSFHRVVVLGERRIGKSSLVNEALLRRKDLRLLYIDLQGVKSIDQLCRRILRSIVSLEQKTGTFDKIIKTLSHLRPSLSLDPITSMPTISFDASIEIHASSIPEVLALIESLARKKSLAVVFDEFQDVLNVDNAPEALALLRSKIQFQGDVPYVFVGSIRHKMDEIFTDHESPFFKSAIPFNVGPLALEEFSKFLRAKFEMGKRNINDNVLDKMFKIANDVPGDVQQLCEASWSATSGGDNIGPVQLKNALELIFARESNSYQHYMSLLTNVQQKCLKAIALKGGNAIYSIPFLKSAGFNNASSVRRAVVRMVKLNILFETTGEFRFTNPFFRVWLLTNG